MDERVPFRILREIDGVVYDSNCATIIHHWDETTLLWPFRWVLGKKPDGRYFLTTISPGTLLRPGPKIRVYPCSRMSSISLVARVGAPDSVLEGLGVEMITPGNSDEPLYQPEMKTVLARDIRFGWQALVKSDSGRFWMVRRRGIFSWKRMQVSPVSHREAIRWAIRNGVVAFSDRLALLGIRNLVGGASP